MTFKEMVDELTNQRFSENKREQCERWVNYRMAMVWAMADWPFKKADRESMTVTNGEITLPPTFRRMTYLESASGYPIPYVTPQQMRFLYEQTNSETSSEPSVYTVSDGAGHVRPKGASSVFGSYERKMCHLLDGDTLTVGPMDSDFDEPVWDAEHHYLLVLGAMSTGLKIENDPTWDALELEFAGALQSMREEYLPPDYVGNRQFGSTEDW